MAMMVFVAFVVAGAYWACAGWVARLHFFRAPGAAVAKYERAIQQYLVPKSLCVTFFLLGCLSLAMPVFEAASDRRLGQTVSMLFFCSFPCVLWLTHHRERDYRRRLREFGGLLCPFCRYPLSDRQSTVTCPECGASMKKEEVLLATALALGLERTRAPH